MEEYLKEETRSNDLFDYAIECIRAGISIIPIDHRTKRPVMRLLPKGEDGTATWKPYQHKIADEATVRRWFAAGIKAFAVVTGAVSGGMLYFDFDMPDSLSDGRTLLAR